MVEDTKVMVEDTAQRKMSPTVLLPFTKALNIITLRIFIETEKPNFHPKNPKIQKAGKVKIFGQWKNFV